MKTTRMIAGTALASLLVIGPLTMTRAHEAAWPAGGYLLSGTSVASGSGSFLSIDLTDAGFSADTLGSAIESTPVGGGLYLRRFAGFYDYVVARQAGSASALLIQIDVQDRGHVVGTLNCFDDPSWGRGIIICPMGDTGPTTVLITSGFRDGMDPQGLADVGDAAALLFASSNQL